MTARQKILNCKPLLKVAVGGLLLQGGILSRGARASDVDGTLRISDPKSSEDTNESGTVGYYGEQPNGFVDVLPTRIDLAREVAVVLTGSGGRPESARCTHVLFGGDLAPRTLVVRVGDDLRIVNRDGFVHELYSVEAKEIPPLQTAPGNERIIRVRRGGHWAIRDRLYPHVRGEVHALPDVVSCAHVRSDGGFVFSNVAPGEYRLRVFYGAKEVFTQWVQVAEGRATALGLLTIPTERPSVR